MLIDTRLLGDVFKQEVPSGTVNGVNTTFTLTTDPIPGTLILTVDGRLQMQGVSLDYTVSGATIDFDSAPQTGEQIYAIFIAK